MAGERNRARRLERLARAQAAVARVERARRAEAEYKRLRCEAEAEEIVAALSGDSPLYGLMLPAMAKMLQANAREKSAIEAEAEEARRSERTERLRAERIEERARIARRIEHRSDEAKRLEMLGTRPTPGAGPLEDSPTDQDG